MCSTTDIVWLLRQEVAAYIHRFGSVFAMLETSGTSGHVKGSGVHITLLNMYNRLDTICTAVCGEAAGFGLNSNAPTRSEPLPNTGTFPGTVQGTVQACSIMQPASLIS